MIFFKKIISILKKDFSLILMLHKVDIVDKKKYPFNHSLITNPKFLEEFIINAKKNGYQFISLDELVIRLQKKISLKRTIILTLDDGYKDNITNAAYIFNKNKVPFCIYLNNSFLNKEGMLWWFALEDALRNDVAKPHADMVFHKHRGALLKNPYLIKQYMEGIFHKKINWKSYISEHCASLKSLIAISKNPLVTIGSHSWSHFCLASLAKNDLEVEIHSSKLDLEKKFKIKIRHFCYPFGGSKECGKREFNYISSQTNFVTATTTTPGVIFPHSTNLASLRRVALSDNFSLVKFLYARNLIMLAIYDLFQ